MDRDADGAGQAAQLSLSVGWIAVYSVERVLGFLRQPNLRADCRYVFGGGELKADNAIDVLKRSLKLIYDDHVGRMVAMPQPYLDSISPNKRLPLQDMLKRYNAKMGAEIVHYGDQLQAEVTGVLEKVKDNPDAPSRDAVMGVVDEFVKPDLYKRRFEIFTEAIARHMQGFGVKFNLHEHRADIPKALAYVGAENGCAVVRRKIANSIDKLYLGNASLEERQQHATGFYVKINQTHEKHPVLFWLVALGISIVFGLMAL